MIRPLLVGLYALLAILVACAPSAAIPQADDDSPVSIPLTISLNPYFGTESPQVAIALGNGQTLPFGFDTGSSGLHVFADARLESTAGVQCSHMPTSVTYGNPPRITFSGVVCYAQLHFQGFTTPGSVPISYLTSASCPKSNPSCKIPNLRSPKAMHGYGVFGAGLTGIMYGNGSVPNPILTLPGRRGTVYSVVVRRESGELVLGASAPSGAADFHLTGGTLPGERYSLPRSCLFINGKPIQSCMLISFDTGNGVPWIHAVRTDSNSAARWIGDAGNASWLRSTGRYSRGDFGACRQRVRALHQSPRRSGKAAADERQHSGLLRPRRDVR